MLLEYRKADKTVKEFVYNEFVKMVYDYVDLDTIDINAVCKEKKSYLTKNIKNYTLIYSEGAFMGCFHLKEEESYFELEDFFVIKDRRRLGFGSNVLGKCLEQARAAKKPVMLEVYKKNLGAIRFFERYGFTILEDLGSSVRMVAR